MSTDDWKNVARFVRRVNIFRMMVVIMKLLARVC